MAEIFTRTYTYTSGTGAASGTLSLSLSQFTATGDTKPITQLLSIDVTHRRYHDTSSTVGYTAELSFANGAAAISSAQSSYRGDGEWHSVANTFTTMPAAGDFTESNVTLSITPSTKSAYVYYRTANTGAKVTVTITYYSSEFKPAMSELRIYRATNLGAESDSGTYVTFTAKLSVESVGTNGSGTLRIYTVNPSSGATTLIYTESSISGSTSGITVTAAPIPSYTLTSGSEATYKIIFSYSGLTSTGFSSTEEVSATRYISSVFTNMHLAGVKTGGVAFGKFSSATQDNPLFECEYPAVFSGGISEIVPTEVYYPTMPSGVTTPGDYGAQLVFRRIGSLVIVQGTVKLTTAASSIDFGSLPDGFVPLQSHYYLCAMTGAKVARAIIRGSSNASNPGTFGIEWVKQLSSTSDVSATQSWIDMSTVYWAA